MHETFSQFTWNDITKSLKDNSTFKIPVKHYSLAKCAFFNNYYIGYESNSEYFTIKSTEKLNPFVFDEDIAGQSNTFVQTFTVCTGKQAAHWCNSQGLLKIGHFCCAAPEPIVSLIAATGLRESFKFIPMSSVVITNFSSSKIFRRTNNKQINKVLNGFHGQLIRDSIAMQNIWLVRIHLLIQFRLKMEIHHSK